MVVCVATNNKKDRYDAIKKSCCIDNPGKQIEKLTNLLVFVSYFPFSFLCIILDLCKRKSIKHCTFLFLFDLAISQCANMFFTISKNAILLHDKDLAFKTSYSSPSPGLLETNFVGLCPRLTPPTMCFIFVNSGY